jgi:hypothetical protein
MPLHKTTERREIKRGRGLELLPNMEYDTVMCMKTSQKGKKIMVMYIPLSSCGRHWGRFSWQERAYSFLE